MLIFFKEFYYYEIDLPREYDFVMPYKKNLLTRIELEIPAGYKVQTLPEKLSIEDEDFSFSMNYKNENGRVFYTKHIRVPKGKIPKGKIENWNTAIKQLKEFYDTPLVLEKN